jgi:hypothetical protein
MTSELGVVEAIGRNLSNVNIGQILLDNSRKRNHKRIDPSRYSLRTLDCPQEFTHVGSIGIELVADGGVIAFLGADYTGDSVLVKQIQGFVKKGDDVYDSLRLVSWDSGMLNSLISSLPGTGVSVVGIEPARMKPGFYDGTEAGAFVAGVITPEDLVRRREVLLKRYDEFALKQGFGYDPSRGFFAKRLIVRV